MSVIDLFASGQPQDSRELLAGGAARRMFRHSAILLAVMVAGAFAAGFATSANKSPSAALRAPAAASGSVFAGRLVTLDPR